MYLVIFTKGQGRLRLSVRSNDNLEWDKLEAPRASMNICVNVMVSITIVSRNGKIIPHRARLKRVVRGVGIDKSHRSCHELVRESVSLSCVYMARGQLLGQASGEREGNIMSDIAQI